MIKLVPESQWGQRATRTQLMAVGEAGSIDEKMMEGVFTACMSADIADTVA